MIANTAAYHFAVIDAPQALCDQLQARAEASGLQGTILVAGEGLNLFLAGAPSAIDGFYAELRADARFADMRVKTSFSERRPSILPPCSVGCGRGMMMLASAW